MRQSLIMVHHPVNNLGGAFISNEISPQIQTREHISVLQKLAKLVHVLVRQLLVFYLNLCRFCDSPAFDR
jgi:hypothetical protein